MFTSDVLLHFGSATAVAQALGITRQAVGQWGDLVPPLSASRLERLTDGRLSYDPDLYARWNNRAKTA